MAKKGGLGTLLDSSIFDDDINSFNEGEEKGMLNLKLSQIEPNVDQPRKNFDKDAMQALANSIAEHGIIQPLTVRELENGMYQIVAGERRWRAANIAGIAEVPVRVMEIEDEEMMQIALIENLQREDLNPIEEARGYEELIKKFEFTQEEVADKVGKARATVTNALRLLSLSDELIQMVVEKKISAGHCKSLLTVTDEETRLHLAKRVHTEGLSVRALERIVKEIVANNIDKPVKTRSPMITEMEISLRNAISKPVRIVTAKNHVTLQIECKNEDELQELINELGNK